MPFDGTIWPGELVGLWDDCAAPTLYDAGSDLRDWATAALDAAPPGPLVVIGNSIGGSCALEILTSAPDRVAAMVLIGSKAGVRRDVRSREEVVEALRDGGVETAFTRYWLPLFAPHTPTEVVTAACRTAVSVGPARLIEGVRAFYDRPDRRRALADARVPVLVVVGDHDRVESAAAMAATAANASCSVISDCGHYPPIEAPEQLAQLVHRLIR